MGYDYDKQRFTPDNHEMLEAQVMPFVAEMQPSDVGYVDAAHVLIDDQRKAWIYKNASLYSPEDVVEHMVDMQQNDGEFINFIRIFCVNEGLGLDESDSASYDWANPLERFDREDAEAVQINPDIYLPIIHRVFNLDELEVIDKALDDNNVFLDETEMEDIIELVGARLVEAEVALESADEEEPEDEEPFSDAA